MKNNDNKLEELYIKLDKAEKRRLRLAVQQHLGFHCFIAWVLTCIACPVVIMDILPWSISTLPTLALGLIGIFILHKKVYPLVEHLCIRYFWKTMKFKIVKRNYILILLIEITLLGVLAWHSLSVYYSDGTI